MTEEDPWRGSDAPPKGPSTPPDLQFDPLATGFGVFVAIAIPLVVLGYTRPSGPNDTIIGLGIVAGLLVGQLAGIWVAHCRGHIWRGPRL